MHATLPEARMGARDLAKGFAKLRRLRASRDIPLRQTVKPEQTTRPTLADAELRDDPVNHTLARVGPQFFCVDGLQHVDVEGLVGDGLLQPWILIPELLGSPRFGDAHAGILLSSRIERRIAHDVLAEHVRDPHALLRFLQYADDLGLGVSLALHGSLQGAGNSSIAWTEKTLRHPRSQPLIAPCDDEWDQFRVAQCFPQDTKLVIQRHDQDVPDSNVGIMCDDQQGTAGC